jgi:hypothetical protein
MLYQENNTSEKDSEFIATFDTAALQLAFYSELYLLIATLIQSLHCSSVNDDLYTSTFKVLKSLFHFSKQN